MVGLDIGDGVDVVTDGFVVRYGNLELERIVVRRTRIVLRILDIDVVFPGRYVGVG